MFLLAALVSALRGYTALSGVMLGIFFIAIPLVGPLLALDAESRLSRVS